MNNIKPKQLFRFFPSAAYTIFETRKLWFSNLEDFNDPFDSCPSFRNQAPSATGRILTDICGQSNSAFTSIRPLLNYESAKALSEQYRETFSKDYCVMCFSKAIKNLHLWSHYAESHRGFAIEMRPENNIFDHSDITGLFRVDYKANRPEHTSHAITANMQTALTKAPLWSREKEWRLIRKAGDLCSGLNHTRKVRPFIELPLDVVKAVYFGCRAEKVIIDEVERLLRGSRFKEVNTFVMREDPYQYKLTMEPRKKRH